MTDSSKTAPSPATTDGPKGIGGWLILPTIGTVVSPFLMAFSTYQSAAALSSSLSAGLQSFIVLEALFNGGLAIAWVVAAFALFTHKRFYPKLFVAILVITLIGTVLDVAVAVSMYNADLDANDVRGLIRSVIGLAIWGPYMFVSKRVRNTFVE
jgi:hypothetical protein